MNDPGYLFGALAAMAIVMFLLRALPFLLFGRNGKTPELVLYIGKVITPAAIAMLIVYCFNGVTFTIYPSCLPELLAGLAIVLVQWKFKNALVSIFGGTIFYMVLVQFIF